MADDEDAIYIDVIPRVDDAAADSAVNRLKDKFKDVAKDVGPEFMDALGDSGALEKLGTKLGEALSGPLKNMSEGIGLDLKNPLEKMLKQDMSGALDDVATQLGTKIANAVKDPLHDVASNIGIDLDDAVSKALNKDWGGLGTSLGKGVGGKIGEALGLGDTLSGLDTVIEKTRGVAEAVQALRGGDLRGGLGGAASLLDGLGIPGGGAANDILKNYDQVKGIVDEVKSLAEGTGLATLLAGPEVAAAVMGGTALLGPGGISDRIGTGLYNAGVGRVPKLDIPAAVGYQVPTGPQQPIVSPFNQPRMGSLSPVAAMPSLPAFAPLDMPNDPRNPTGRTGISTSVEAPHSSGSANVQAQQANVSAGSATVVASSVSLGGVSISSLGVGSAASAAAPSAHPTAGSPVLNTPHGPTSFTNPLDLLAPKDKHSTGGLIPHFSGGGKTSDDDDSGTGDDSGTPNYDPNDPNLLGPGRGLTPHLDPISGLPAGVKGNFNPNVQLDTSTTSIGGPPKKKPYQQIWDSVTNWLRGGDLHDPSGGFGVSGVLPGDSPGHDNILGSSGGHPIGLEGGEFVVNPKATQNNLDLLKAINSSAHFDAGGETPMGGDSNNPTLAEPPTQGNTEGGGGNGPKQQQQLGKGSGGGISGGGLIGAAEQAGVAAAAIGGFGGGGIAAQMAVQETNLAVQKTSQMVAALATAPFETFGLQGGMMGAPQVNPMGGWIGKLIAGQLGSQTSLPNLAGAVQPPKKPEQKPEDGQQPQGETPSGPSGEKDDPMHVKVLNQGTPPQGSATSSMNAVPGLTMSVP